jgi:hypothetical protein
MAHRPGNEEIPSCHVQPVRVITWSVVVVDVCDAGWPESGLREGRIAAKKRDRRVCKSKWAVGRQLPCDALAAGGDVVCWLIDAAPEIRDGNVDGIWHGAGFLELQRDEMVGQ